MTNYKQSDVSGSTWVRAFRVEINNAYKEIPSIEFREESVFMLNDEVIKVNKPISPSSTIRQFMTDPAISFDLIDPDTQKSIGTATYKDVYIMMQSLYRNLAESRDKGLALALAAEQPTTETTTQTTVEPKPTEPTAK